MALRKDKVWAQTTLFSPESNTSTNRGEEITIFMVILVTIFLSDGKIVQCKMTTQNLRIEQRLLYVTRNLTIFRSHSVASCHLTSILLRNRKSWRWKKLLSSFSPQQRATVARHVALLCSETRATQSNRGEPGKVFKVFMLSKHEKIDRILLTRIANWKFRRKIINNLHENRYRFS